MQFLDREDAGRRLAAELGHHRGERPVVVAMPRGGVPVGYEIARALGAPLDVVVVRKLGAPGHEELAVGAMVDGDHPEVVLNRDVIRALGVRPDYLEAEKRRQLAQIHARQRRFRSGRPALDLHDRTAILVDDGIATGATARAAILGILRRRPRRVVLAVPVAPPDAVRALGVLVDEVVCLATPEPFGAVGFWYADFTQTSDDEVVRLLESARERPGGA
jgi:putative phosphoribosyl transferase